MRLVLLMALAACSAPSRTTDFEAVPDALAPDAWQNVDPAPLHREVTAVVVGPQHVTWSLSEELCPLEGGPCDHEDPTILRANLDATAHTTLVATWNRVTIAGDAAGAFFVDQDNDNSLFVARVPDSPGQLPQPISLPTATSERTQIDHDFVYWLASDGLRRASRTGDGNDDVLVSNIVRADFRVLADRVWWGTYDAVTQQSSLHHIPVAGGPEVIIDGDLRVLAAENDVVYVTQRIGTGFMHYIIGAMTLDGVVTPLLDVAQHEQPQQLIVDGDTLYWSTSSGTIRRMPITGGTPTDLVPASSAHFGLTSTSLLHSFDQQTFQITTR